MKTKAKAREGKLNCKDCDFKAKNDAGLKRHTSQRNTNRYAWNAHVNLNEFKVLLETSYNMWQYHIVYSVLRFGHKQDLGLQCQTSIRLKVVPNQY